jgi:hypothetical protein
MSKVDGAILRRVVSLLVNEPNWPREMKIAKKITKNFPEIKFWEDIAKLFPKKLPSLAFFLTPAGKTIISREKNKINIDTPTPNPIIFSESKVGEDIPTVRKIKSLKDFIKYG